MSFLKMLVVWEIIAVIVFTIIAVFADHLSAWYTVRLVTCGFIILDILVLATAHILQCNGTNENPSFLKFIVDKWNDD